MIIRQAKPDEERRVRRFILLIDPEFALHKQIKDYFLAGTSSFGLMMVEGDAGEIKALACFTIMIEKHKSCIHNWMGDINYIDAVREKLGYPCQVFLGENVAPPPGWYEELRVTPGYVIDHPAYSLVFTRLAPRFAGVVYGHD